MNVQHAQIEPGWGTTLYLTIDGHRFHASEKHTFIELGWAILGAESPLPKGWIREIGETRPSDDEWNEIASNESESTLVTSHPIAVACLVLWMHRLIDQGELSEVVDIEVPEWEEAVEIVRQRKILNDFNQVRRGVVPGLEFWGPDQSTPGRTGRA